MSLVILNPSDYEKQLQRLEKNTWLFVCFCAGWCNSCREYLPQLKKLAKARKDVHFIWVDIEEHADMLGDLDIYKFPSILIQYDNTVAFYSCIHPDAALSERVLQSMIDTPIEEHLQKIQEDKEHQQWQNDWNFLTLLKNGMQNSR